MTKPDTTSTREEGVNEITRETFIKTSCLVTQKKRSEQMQQGIKGDKNDISKQFE